MAEEEMSNIYWAIQVPWQLFYEYSFISFS